MPQFNPDILEPQIFWLIVSFALLYWLLKTHAIPRISEVLEEREHKINDSLRKADLLRDDAEAKMAEYERTMAEARVHAQDTVRAVRERIAQEAAEQNAELSARLQLEVSAAEARIGKAREEAMANMRTMSIDISQAAAERLVGSKVTKTSVTAAVDHVLKAAP